MRKAYKVKKRSCPLCKPHKMGHANRWKTKEAEELRRSEKETSDAVKRRE